MYINIIIKYEPKLGVLLKSGTDNTAFISKYAVLSSLYVLLLIFSNLFTPMAFVKKLDIHHFLPYKDLYLQNQRQLLLFDHFLYLQNLLVVYLRQIK